MDWEEVMDEVKIKADAIRQKIDEINDLIRSLPGTVEVRISKHNYTPIGMKERTQLGVSIFNEVI